MRTDLVVIVTGAGSGIGRAAARALHSSGFRVVLAGRRRDALEASASGMSEGCHLVLPCDVTQVAQVQDLFAQTQTRFGRVDVLFNNAGTGAPPLPLDELSPEQWQGVVDVNLTGMFLCLREAFRVMKSQSPRGGRVINNGSIAATTPRPHSIAYTATKHGVTGLTKAAALEGRAFDIAVGQIDVGNAGTEMTQRMAQGILQANGSVASEPLLDVEIVARSIVYMAGLPLDANVLFHTVMATKMPFVGRG